MAGAELIVSRVEDVTVVSLRMPSLLEESAIEQVGKSLFAIVDEQACRKLVVDFRLVNTLSSRMLGMLVSLYKRAAAIKGKVVLVGLRPSLMKVFQITRLDRIMNFAPDESTAMHEF